MRRHGPALVAAALALGCGAPRVAPPPVPPVAPVQPSAAAPSAKPIPPPVARGMGAAQVRRALGAPARVEAVPSAAAKGARYERWTYADRVVVLLDGEVVDVLPVASGR